MAAPHDHDEWILKQELRSETLTGNFRATEHQIKITPVKTITVVDPIPGYADHVK